MPYFTTDFIEGDAIRLRDVEVQISQEKPSAYEATTFVCGRIELPPATIINTNSHFFIRGKNNKKVEIVWTQLINEINRTVFRFRTLKPAGIEEFI